MHYNCQIGTGETDQFGKLKIKTNFKGPNGPHAETTGTHFGNY